MLRDPTTISLQLPRLPLLPLLPLLLSLQASHPLFNELLLPRLVFASFVVVMMRKTIWFNRISTWVSKNARTTMTVGATDRGPEHRYRVKHSFILCGHRSADELASGSCQATCRLEDRSVHPPFWNYSHNFQKEPAKVSFHENFLGLARAYKECEFDGEVARLVKTLQDVPAGYAFCTGGLGSGKTTTVHNIVKAILFGTVENIDISDPDAEQWETSEAPADAIPQYEVVPTPSGANLECGMYAIVKSMSHQLPDHAPSIDDLRDLLNGPEMTERMAPLFDIGQSNLTADQIAAVLQLWGDQRGIVLRLNVIVEGDQLQVIFPTDDCTTIWIHNDNAVELSGTDFNHYSGVKLAAATSPSTELDLAQQVLQSLTHIQGMVSVPALDVDEEAPAPLTEYEEPELGEYKKAEGFVSAKDTAGNSFDQSSNKPRVAWIAAQNKVVNNAAHCAFLQCLTRQFRVE
ncbi:hypothetical protein IWW34DRAFT_783311 [Fusarium oxysporum f. sp. albedinis]|nr:hypothetical protein IWW34DRAFT_783311 [Fusarium oxysporum f. sp. albedinis]